MQQTSHGAITSPHILQELYKATNAFNPACGMLFLFIVQTGNTTQSSIKIKVKEMRSYIAQDNCLLTEQVKERFLKYCDSHDDEDFFFTHNGVTLTRNIVKNTFTYVSNRCRPYSVSSLALRKTYLWNQYLKVVDKRDLMYKIKCSTVEDVAAYFEVPTEALTDRDRGSAKTLVLTHGKTDVFIDETIALLEKIRSEYQNTLLPDSYYTSLMRYIEAVDTANILFTNELKSE